MTQLVSHRIASVYKVTKPWGHMTHLAWDCLEPNTCYTVFIRTVAIKVAFQPTILQYSVVLGGVVGPMFVHHIYCVNELIIVIVTYKS